MSQQDRAAAELRVAREALVAISALVAEGREVFEHSADRRAHLAELWIVVGSRLKNHCTVLDIPRATGEFASAIAFRQKLAYRRPTKRDDALLWSSSVTNAPVLAADVADTLAAIEQEPPG